ncbi:MAG: hypothetical protein U0236_22885, partial [Nitrospira sp.]
IAERIGRGGQVLLAALLPAASAGEDLPLLMSIPTGGTELNGGMGEAIDRFHSLFDDRPAI